LGLTCRGTLVSLPGMNPLTLSDYFKLHGRPADSALVSNAELLLAKVNALLEEAAADGVSPGTDQISGNAIPSGYRSPGANARTANAATNSTHLTCEGIDVQDLVHGRPLAVWCCKNQDLLERLGLYMEDPRWTAGRTRTDPWVHLQDRAPRSGKRIYVPSTAPAQDPDFYSRNGLKAPA
jgi:hypothetical protein